MANLTNYWSSWDTEINVYKHRSAVYMVYSAVCRKTFQPSGIRLQRDKKHTCCQPATLRTLKTPNQLQNLSSWFRVWRTCTGNITWCNAGSLLNQRRVGEYAGKRDNLEKEVFIWRRSLNHLKCCAWHPRSGFDVLRHLDLYNIPPLGVFIIIKRASSDKILSQSNRLCHDSIRLL